MPFPEYITSNSRQCLASILVQDYTSLKLKQVWKDIYKSWKTNQVQFLRLSRFIIDKELSMLTGIDRNEEGDIPLSSAPLSLTRSKCTKSNDMVLQNIKRMRNIITYMSLLVKKGKPLYVETIDHSSGKIFYTTKALVSIFIFVCIVSLM